MEVGKVRTFLITLGKADGYGWASGRLDKILGATCFQPLYQINDLGKVDHRCVRSGSSHSTREAFPDRDLGADEEVLIRHRFTNALVKVKCELAAVFPGSAIFPLACIVGAQDLRTEVAVTEFHIDAIRTGIIGDLGSQHKIIHDLFKFFLGEDIALISWQQSYRKTPGKFGVA